MGVSTAADPLEVVSARPACRHSGFILKLRSLQARLGLQHLWQPHAACRDYRLRRPDRHYADYGWPIFECE
jgi:hypothetical protein